MEMTIPIYVETTALPGKRPEYVVRPLFFDSPVERAELLSTALQKLTRSLRKQLVELGRQQRHDALAAWSSNPDLETQQCRIRIERNGSITRLRLLLISVRRFQRRLAFTPAFPELWFEMGVDEAPEQRLTESLTVHLKMLESEGRGINAESLRGRSLEGSAWVTEIHVGLTPERLRAGKQTSVFALLGSGEQMNGEWELYRVGRRLNDQYPHDLNRALLREREVEELERVLSSSERRPVLLLGRHQSGRTTVLHEFVYRNQDRVEKQQGNVRAVWLISPQRLISGMSYVGQWESRFHAIMAFAARRDLVVYFDDLPGLFQAGVTGHSTISAAVLLRTILSNRTVRICGEATPEQFRVLQEQDRTFADQFHVIRVEELGAEANLRVLLAYQRQLEARHGVCFELETLPAIINLQRRYVRDAAFPGKAAELMKRLAVRYGAGSEDVSMGERRRVPISQDRVFESFRRQSGLPLSFLDQRTRLERGQISAALRERFVGQPQAVDAAVEIIGTARARLNDPSRPMATLLLPGPTGVGKTEFARAVAGCLFGSAERLLRFDMNEYVSAAAVPLLAGTFAQPDGLLTTAVRRQPFAVLLFDEIEKAHPNVFDLLLQVLGEGRLTDARGRTTDFANTLIILTSNLGTQRSSHSPGFGSGAVDTGHLAVRAAEQFFRPEFFNRIDRVIPFERLSRVDVQAISRHFMAGVLQREGLIRRQCVLNVSAAVTDWVVEQGFNPVLGARALKRAIERELAQPVSALLADLPGDDESAAGPSVLSLLDIDRGGSGLMVSLRRLRFRDAQQLPLDNAENGVQPILAECDRLLSEVEGSLPQLRTTSVFDSRALTPVQSRYLLVQDEVRRLRGLYEDFAAAESARKPRSAAPAIHHRGRARTTQALRLYGRADWRDQLAAEEFDEAIEDFVEDENLIATPPLQPRAFLARCCWLRTLAVCDVARLEESVTLRVKLLDADRVRCLSAWSQWFIRGWSGPAPGENWGLEIVVQEEAAGGSSLDVRIEGLLAADVAASECGFQLLEIDDQASPVLLVVSDPCQPPPEVLVRRLQLSADTTRVLSPGHAELSVETWRPLRP
ncbi:MAG: AAA family ATPase [Planctomycetota bacterium]